MNVTFDGIVYSFAVKPGKHGYQDFTERIRQAFHLPQGCELNITFTCDEPSTGLPLTIHGQGAYDAAVHCAGISAARRKLASSEVSSVGDSDLPSPSHAPLKRNSLGEWSIRVRQAILHMFSR